MKARLPCLHFHPSWTNTVCRNRGRRLLRAEPKPTDIRACLVRELAVHQDSLASTAYRPFEGESKAGGWNSDTAGPEVGRQGNRQSIRGIRENGAKLTDVSLLDFVILL